MKKKVLVIVAHPDDEIIWVGGSLIRHKQDWNTTIISMCRKSDKDRNPKFKKVCKILKAKSIIYDLDDEKLTALNLKKYKDIILKYSKDTYDYIFTHGSNGEYGHIRHKEIHKAVKDLIKLKKLKAKKVFFFSHKKRKNNFQGYSIYNSSANIFIKLNRDELSLKKHLIKDIYGYQKNGFEEKSCGKIEAFDILKNENISSISISSRS